MKISRTIFFACVMWLVIAGACKKQAGPGGKNTISGSVVFKNGVTGNNDAAPMATISIAYGTDEPTTTFNQTILAGDDGKYSFDGLKKGKYFVKASYTDEHGFNYSDAGHGIYFLNNKKNLTVDITLE